MSRSDKTVALGLVAVVCVGLIHYQLDASKKRVAVEAAAENLSAAGSGLVPVEESAGVRLTTPWQGGDMAAYVAPRPAEERKTLAGLVTPRSDFVMSRSAQKRAALQQAVAQSREPGQPAKVDLPVDFDYFAAKERMKERVFDPAFDPQGEMTEAEKWELVESGNLPW